MINYEPEVQVSCCTHVGGDQSVEGDSKQTLGSRLLMCFIYSLLSPVTKQQAGVARFGLSISTSSPWLARPGALSTTPRSNMYSRKLR